MPGPVREHGRMQQVRIAVPADYDAIAPVVDEWWGRPIRHSLPRLFLDLFYATSLVIDGADGPDAFLIGIFSPSQADHAYIHFVGVAPHARRLGYGRQLYEEFFRSAEFHRALGFTVSGPVTDYDGPGHDMLVFSRVL
jgi:ribosomal protein S18 acetylase RimI-like enzyme